MTGDKLRNKQAWLAFRNSSFSILNSTFYSDERSQPAPGWNAYEDEDRLEAEADYRRGSHFFVLSLGALIAKPVPGWNEEQKRNCEIQAGQKSSDAPFPIERLGRYCAGMFFTLFIALL